MATDKLEFFLPMEPPKTTHQMKKATVKNGRIRFYEPPALADAREKLLAHLGAHRPQYPLDGTLRLTTRWLFTGRVISPRYRQKKPDTDNLVKLLKDCMTALHFWNDDSQVASELIEKFDVPDKPGIYVRVEVIPGGGQQV